MTFINSKRQYKVYSNGTIEYAGIKNDENSKLAFNVVETESRAVILQVSVNGVESLEDWLKSLSEDELKTVFLKSWYGEDAQWSNVTYWNEATQSEQVCTDVRDYYNKYYSDICNDEYEMMSTQGIDWETGKPLTLEYYDKLYGPEIQLGEEIIKSTVAEFIITNPGNYNISATTKDGEYIEDTWGAYPSSKIETYSTTKAIAENGKNSQTITSKDNKTVEVPAGFYYGTNDNVGKVSNGFVITDSVGENGYSNGNEFVWIPVDKDNLTVGDTNKKMAKLKDGSTTDYEGILYDWETDSTGNTIYQVDNNTDGYMEPISEHQDNYNSMIQSIKKYGGFYVGRYEMGFENEKVLSKLGVLPYNPADTNWNVLYSKALLYSKDSIQSSAIWGSQYDAMLQYALVSGEDSAKVNSADFGNKEARALECGYTKTSDKINNVFDLSGNIFDCTQDIYVLHRTASSVFNYMTVRGGTEGDKKPSDRDYRDGSYFTSYGKGTRLSLYIKP